MSIINRLTKFSNKLYHIDKQYPKKEDFDKAKASGEIDKHYKEIDDEPSLAKVGYANLVSSRCSLGGSLGGTHAPAIDIDFPVYAVPSRTPGHTHLYIDKVMTWEQYEKLLDAMVECGIVEEGFRDVGVMRKETLLRIDSYKMVKNLENENHKEQPTNENLLKIGNWVKPKEHSVSLKAGLKAMGLWGTGIIKEIVGDALHVSFQSKLTEGASAQIPILADEVQRVD